MIRISRSDVIAIFQGLGVPSADGWSRDKMQRKLDAVHQIVPEGGTVGDDRLDGLLNDLITARENDESIELLSDKQMAEYLEEQGQGESEEEKPPVGEYLQEPEPELDGEAEEQESEEQRSAEPETPDDEEDDDAPPEPEKKKQVKVRKKVAKKKPAKSTQVKKKTAKKKLAESKSDRMSLIEAAYVVLAKQSEPMTAKEIVEKITERGLWEPKNGKTPDRTLGARIYTEINNYGEESRFQKVGRGKFAAK